MADRPTKYGDHVVYVDSVGNTHDALVSAPWGATCCNLLYVSQDETRKDGYGRQIERQCSCIHMSLSPVHGNYWRWPDEAGKPTERPFAARA